MFKIIKNNKGFSVLEAIFSIAAIALMSGFILQMFLVSDNVNKNAENIDKATEISSSEIEKFKALKDFSEVPQEYQLAYDKDWNKIDVTGGDPEKSDGRFILDFKYTVNKELSNASESDTGQGGTFCDIAVTVKDLKKAVENQEIINLDAGKYFLK